MSIPPDTQCFVSPYLLGRNRRAWGDDVLEFKPERFAGKGRAGGAAHPYRFVRK